MNRVGGYRSPEGFQRMWSQYHHVPSPTLLEWMDRWRDYVYVPSPTTQELRGELIDFDETE